MSRLKELSMILASVGILMFAFGYVGSGGNIYLMIMGFAILLISMSFTGYCSAVLIDGLTQKEKNK